MTQVIRRFPCFLSCRNSMPWQFANVLSKSLALPHSQPSNEIPLLTRACPRLHRHSPSLGPQGCPLCWLKSSPFSRLLFAAFFLCDNPFSHLQDDFWQEIKPTSINFQSSWYWCWGSIGLYSQNDIMNVSLRSWLTLQMQPSGVVGRAYVPAIGPHSGPSAA